MCTREQRVKTSVGVCACVTVCTVGVLAVDAA